MWSTRSLSSFWMIIQKLFWESVVLHSMNMLEPIASVCTKLFFYGCDMEFLQKFLRSFCGQEECTPLFAVDIYYLLIVHFMTAFQQLRRYGVEWKGDKRLTKWKRFGRKRSWPNLKVQSWNSSGRTEENQEHLSEDSRWSGRDFNPWPSVYEAGALTTRSRRSVMNIKMLISEKPYEL
jgi:hypothetical protein